MTRTRRTPLAVLVLLLVSGLLAGCVSMPDSGPVVETQAGGGVSTDGGIYFNPRPPQVGDTPADIVRGFLVAMRATPIQTNTAREFLTEDAAAAWAPEDETITYAGYPRVSETADGVSVSLSEPDWLDAQGAWQGPLPKSQRTIGFPMAFENGEWRIDDAPDALVVPETWFATRYQQVSLYYFDPTASTLSPEPVYVAGGKQLASTLTQALLLGPGPGLDRVVKSFLPPDLSVYLSVPISDEGIADIGLKGDAGQLTPKSIELMMVQLAWTLRQDPRIKALRVSVNGDPVPLPGGVSAYRVDGDSQYDPAASQASPLLYGLRDGLLSSGTDGTLAPVTGPMGTTDLGLRSVAVSLTADLAAGVADDGRSLIVGPVSSDDTPADTVVTGARSLLRPAWDFSDRLWVVDQTSNGAAVSWIKDGKSHPIDVPGISHTRVRSFLISRDGTRLVAVVRQPEGDELRVSRIAHDRHGTVLWATSSRPIWEAPDSDLPVRAIAWRSSTTLAVLSPFGSGDNLVQLRTASIDGSPASDSSSPTVEGGLRTLAGSPNTEETLYGANRQILVNLSSRDRRVESLPEGTTQISYVG